MNNCTILSDAVVQGILNNTSRDELLVFLDKVANALRDFSVSERNYQPPAPVINRPDGHEDIFRLFTSNTGVGVKIIVHPAQAIKQASYASEAERIRMTSLHGVLALCDENGFGTGFINAEELTAYRTSLCAMWVYIRRKNTAHVVIFGAGKCALWHARLVLALRGHEIETLAVVNRSGERTRLFVEQMKAENEARWRAPIEFKGIAMSDTGSESQIQASLAQADVIFCTTASKEILVSARHLSERIKDCYISAIGSWREDMIEVDPAILRDAAQREDRRGLVIVDSLEECFKNTGEIVQSGLSKDKFVELGNVVDCESQALNKTLQTQTQCLETGLVIYKSVGVSMTDLAIGQALLDVAKEQGLGVFIPDF